jgi:methionine biosynthesis protein MetW
VIAPEQERVAAWVAEGSRVLDLGCGDGALLAHLREQRGVHGYGVEIDFDNIVRCVARGVNVVQADLDAGLATFETDSFDTVILLQTLQAVRFPLKVLREMLRVGREGVVTFPNFGYWRARGQLTLGGRMPVTPGLPAQWYETANIHLCTLRDFEALCRQERIEVAERVVIGPGQREGTLTRLWPSLFAEVAVYRLRRG